MHPNFYLSSLAACLVVTLASSAEAAQPLPVKQTTLQSLQQQFQLILPGMKQATANSPTDSLSILKTHTDKNNINHIRLQQKYAGFHVYGGDAIIHSPESIKSIVAKVSGNVTMNGMLYKGIEADLGKPSTNFVQNGANALQNFKELYLDKDISDERVTPMVYVDEQHKAHWAYQVTLLVTHDNQIPERPTAIIDAATFKPFIQWNDIKTAATRTPVKGLGYGGNRKVGMWSYGMGMPYLELTRDNEGRSKKCYMENNDVRVVDMRFRRTSDNKAMQFPCKAVASNPADIFWTGYKGDGLDNKNGAYSPTNDALYAGYVIKRMYQDWYKVEPLTKANGSPMQLVMRVHYDKGYENAYWDGEQMTFGDGESMMYPLVSLGIGAHEISHGFTEQHSNLNYYGQSGGMNESFSDMAAQAAEFYSSGKNKWMIGDDIMKESSGYETLRYMDIPSKDGSSIDKASDYRKGLDVHYSSGVFNRLFYLMANQDGWDTRKAFNVMIKANMDYWVPSTNFIDGACGVLSAANDLKLPTDDIKRSLEAVAIDYKTCS